MKQWISPAAAFSFSYFSCLETSIPAHHHSMSTLGDKFSPKVQCVYMLHDKVNISFPSHNHRHRTCNTMQPIHTPVQLHNTVIRLCLQLIMFIIYIYTFRIRTLHKPEGVKYILKIFWRLFGTVFKVLIGFAPAATGSLKSASQSF